MMKIASSIVRLVVASWANAVLVHAAFAAGSYRGPEVLVAADAFTVPEDLRPSPGKPVYYVFSQAQKSLGDSVAGVKMPDSALVERAVVAELAKQGFVRSQVGGPIPSVYIVALLGTSNFSPASDDDIAFYQAMTLHGTIEEAAQMAFQNSARFKDKSKVETIVGVGKLQNIQTPNGSKVAQAANEDRLYVSIIAFDALLWVKKERRLLWRTSMSIDWRNDFSTSFTAMLASGGPSFGHNLKEPTFLDDRDRRNSEVQIGEAQVVPDDKLSQPKKGEK